MKKILTIALIICIAALGYIYSWKQNIKKEFAKECLNNIKSGRKNQMSDLLDIQIFENYNFEALKAKEVLSMADFSNYYDAEKSKIDYDAFPALRTAKGYEVILEHGDTLFMPGGYWHHMEYLDSGFAISLRAVQSDMTGKLSGV